MSLLPPAPARSPSAPRTRMSVRVGGARAAAQPAGSPPLAFVALAPPGAPWLADLFPNAVLRATRDRDPSQAVEHLRLQGRDRLELLPGLTGPYRSRLRDAAILALAAGAGSVDLVVAHGGARPPWRVLDRDIQECMDPFLAEIPGALLLYPDFCGPLPVGPGTEVPAAERLREGLSGLDLARPRWTERTQTALLDHPGVTDADHLTLLRALHGADASLCRWSGDAASLARHGWRSAAAVVAGALSGPSETPGRPIEGRALPLAPGRAGPPDRISALRLDEPQPLPVEGAEDCLELAITPGADQVLVRREPTMRAPIGAWTLTSLRLVKLVHRQLLETAERFVFQIVDDSMAIALAVSLQRALGDLARRGLLTGPGGAGMPQVKGGTLRSPTAPGLYAVISAQLRPWAQSIQVRISLRPGSQPILEQP